MLRTIVGFLLLIGLLALFPPSFSFAQQTTMCISQFALANQACGVLPSELALRGRNSSRSKADDSDSGTSNDDDSDDDDDDGVDNSNGDSDDNDDGGDESERRRKSDRGNKKKGRKHEKHGGKRRRGHGQKHEDDEPRANKDCCRWLEELDESCVCAALLHLPAVLVKPNHKYSIKVGKTCKFSYSCYGI